MRTSPIGIPAGWVTPVLSALFVVCWSSGFIGAKLGAADAPPQTVLMWRFMLIAVVLGVVFGVKRRRAAIPSMSLRQWGIQMAIGVLSQAGYTGTVYWAIALGVSTGTTALVDGIQPLVVAALAGPILGAVTLGRQWWGLLVGAAGVLVVTGTDATASGAHAPWWAYLVPLGGMAALVAATFLDRRAPATPPQMLALAIHCGTSAVFFAVACVATGEAIPPMAGSFWMAVAWLMFVSTVGGYGLYWVMLARVGVTSVNSLLFLMPPVTAVWGGVMYGEPFTVTTALGLAMALGATWVVKRSARTEPAARTEESGELVKDSGIDQGAEVSFRRSTAGHCRA